VLNSPPEITCLIRETLMLPFPVPCALPGWASLPQPRRRAVELRHVLARQRAL